MIPENNGVFNISVKTTDGRILEGWARSRTDEGLLYYLNHTHGITQWDHPEYIRILDELLPINTVKYAAYRTACKLRHLQTRLKAHDVSLQCVASAFDCAGLKAAQNNDIVPVLEIERVLLYIFRTTIKNKIPEHSLCADLVVNLILNTYDENRSGNLQVLKCKVFMVVMCGGRLQEKYRYLFNQIADHNNCCTRRKLGKLLQILANVTELLSEQLSFGSSLVTAAVDSCFKEVEGDIGITEDGFLTWLIQEPQTLVWWTTLYRLASAELVCHDIKCGSCKQRPIIGLRYQCLKCLGYNLCQDCFLHGRKSKSHKLSHPMQEYCHESTNKEWRKSILKILRHKLRKSHDLKPRYLTISAESGQSLRSLLQETIKGSSNDALNDGGSGWSVTDASSDGEVELMSRTICQSVDDLDRLDGENGNSSECSGTSEQESTSSAQPIIVRSSPRQQINSVIKHLQDGQKQLSDQLDTANKPCPIPPNIVEDHMAELQTQINRLQNILKNFSKIPMSRIDQLKALPRMESTPIVGERGLHLSFSPIGPQSNNPNDSAVLDNKENHFTEKQKVESCQVSPTLQPNPTFESRPQRISLSIVDNNKQSTFIYRENTPPKYGNKLSSFTETDWSTLNSCSRLNSQSSNESDSPKAGSSDEWSVVKEKDNNMQTMKQEINNILYDLENIFNGPNAQEEWGLGTQPVITAGFEVGDAVADFVDRVPPKGVVVDVTQGLEASANSDDGV